MTEAESLALPLDITDLSRGGAGVARLPDGRAVFVPLTLPGDRVQVRIVRTEKRYAQAEVVEWLEKSPHRAEPRCRVFGQCGGCLWQHVPYDLQWKTKKSGVLHALSRVGIPAPDGGIEELPAERAWEYRNRIQLRCDEEGRLGFYARGSHTVVEIERCEIARPEINAVLPGIREKGSATPKPFKVELEVLESGKVRESWNAKHAAAGFRQVHDEQNEKLRAWIARSIDSGRTLLDLYGGSGNLSLGLASRMAAIECVDTGSPAIRPEGTPENYRFHRAPVLPWLRRRKDPRPGGGLSVILDPPREGLGEDGPEIARILEALGADEAIFVGCDADSWARDLSRFVRRGWKVRSLGVLDLFPQTPHVEALARLSL